MYIVEYLDYNILNYFQRHFVKYIFSHYLLNLNSIDIHYMLLYCHILNNLIHHDIEYCYMNNNLIQNHLCNNYHLIPNLILNHILCYYHVLIHNLKCIVHKWNYFYYQLYMYHNLKLYKSILCIDFDLYRNNIFYLKDFRILCNQFQL